MTESKIVAIFFFIVSGLFIFALTNAQNNSDTISNKYLYHPPSIEKQDTIVLSDSLLQREQFIRDSVEARLKFIQDSLVAREKFVRDSIQRRQRILDSLTILKRELPLLITATIKTITEQLIIHHTPINIVGDSTLSDFTYYIAPFSLSEPFTPWKSTLNLSDNPVKIQTNALTHQITAIKASFFNCKYNYNVKNNLLVINEQEIVMSNRSGDFYKVPLDSVFFDRLGRIVKIKKYIQFHQLANNYQKGAFLFIHLSQVKQYGYNSANLLTTYQEINFCDRWKITEPVKVCNILDYNISNRGKIYSVAKKNDPSNDFSDGTYVIEFDNDYNPKSQSFNNSRNTENWKCFIEMNESGNVSRYVYQRKGKVNETLLVNYYLDDPQAKNKVETISCYFDDDGISYRQLNNTTGKSRERDRLTLEWGPWE